MEQIKETINKMISQTSLVFDRLPDIDLYMDQVIEYLSRQSLSPRDNDKISSAMINNYIKDGLLPRANDKKYGRDHLAYLIMISRLKQSLSVKDTGVLLKTETEGKNIDEYFNEFQKLLADTASSLGEALPEKEEALSRLALRLAVEGYVNSIVCEMILSKLSEGMDEDPASSDDSDEENAEKKDKNESKKDKSSSKKEKK